MGKDDDEAGPDQISLGGETAALSAGRLLKIARERLGRWFPVVVTAVALSVGALLVTAVIQQVDDPAAPAAPPSTPDLAGSAAALDRLPVGPRPRLPYFADGRLSWPGGGIELNRENMAGLVSRHGTSLLRAWTGQQLLLLDGPDLSTIASDVLDGPAISADGRLVAWLAAAEGDTTAVLWDTRIGSAASTLRVHLPFACCVHPGLHIDGIDARGRVYLTAATQDGPRYLMWDPSQEDVREIGGSRSYASMTTVTQRGPLFTDLSPFDPRARSVYGTVNADATFRRLGALPVARGSWSPAGDVVLHITADGRVAASSVNRRTVTLETPPGWRPAHLAWERGAALVVVIDPLGTSAWVRCDPMSGACELAAQLGGTTASGIETWVVASNSPPVD